MSITKAIANAKQAIAENEMMSKATKIAMELLNAESAAIIT